MDGYGKDLPRALDQTRAMSIRTLAVSTNIESFRATQRIACREPLILPSFGIHLSHVESWTPSMLRSYVTVVVTMTGCRSQHLRTPL